MCIPPQLSSTSANTFVPISKPPAYETDYWQRENDDDGGNEITVSYPRYPRTNPHSPAARVPSSVYLGDDDYGYKVRNSTVGSIGTFEFPARIFKIPGNPRFPLSLPRTVERDGRLCSCRRPRDDPLGAPGRGRPRRGPRRAGAPRGHDEP